MLISQELPGTTVSFARKICQLVVLPQIEELTSIARHSDVLVRTAAIAELQRLLAARTDALHAEIAQAIMPRAKALLADETSYLVRKLLADLCQAAN